MRKNDAREGLIIKYLVTYASGQFARVQEGESPEVVARVLDLTRQTMYGWLARYRSGGWGALEAGKRGGRPPKLDAKAIDWIYNTVTMKNPLQLKFPYALWISGMIAVLIRQKYGVEISRTSVSRLLNQLGLSVQRPLWRAYQQDRQTTKYAA